MNAAAASRDYRIDPAPVMRQESGRDWAAPDPAALRRVLGRFATGVAVVSTRTADGRLAGLTVNSFSSVSLAPPLVLWSLRRDASLFPVFTATGHWAINVLSAEQLPLARQFCSPLVDRFAGVQVSEGLGGVPLLPDTIASLECSAWQTLDGGDHVIFLGRVERCTTAEGSPLLFHGGAFGDWLPRQT